MADLTVQGTLINSSRAAASTIAGFRVTAALDWESDLAPAGEEATPIVVTTTGTATVGVDGRYRISLPDNGSPAPELTLTVYTPDGDLVKTASAELNDLADPVDLRVRGLVALQITESDSPTKGGRATMTGAVIDNAGTEVPAGLPVVLWGVADGDGPPDPYPMVVTTTQAGGFFSADWVATAVSRAFGRVAGSEPVEIGLDGAGRLPRYVLLVLDLPADDDSPEEHRRVPAVAPTSTDLTSNPKEFSQDLGRGCVNLTQPNRAVEEFIYTMVVRTSEPEVKGVTLGRRLVPPVLFTPLLEASAIREVLTQRQVVAATPGILEGLKDLRIDASAALQLVNNDTAPTVSALKRAAWLSETGLLKDLIGGTVTASRGRTVLDGDAAIDWDYTPTIYEAVTIARGHVLEFREVWRADGYSLGDLLQSLPLAPGQRRRVAVVDWERRTTSTREESLEFEEQLNALSDRDRDISEIVGSRLAQEQTAGSSNTTWGVAGGIGAGFVGSGFGIFGGVAGSHGGSSSSSWQDSSRSFAGDSLQSLRDRVMQRASAVRDQRITVVQTAAEGETLRAETEVVANYNHCHAMTVEYFEVLRHFLVTHELADVRECLFVPLPIREFDRGKALRWQTPLASRLRERSLLPGFDAIRRIADDWKGWDYPLSRYSEEPPEVLEGELRISFVLPRPRDAEDGKFQVENWQPYKSFLPQDAAEMFTKIIAESGQLDVARRDRQFREKIAPDIAARIIDRLRFGYVDDNGREVEVPLDATLVSRYGEGVPLYVSVRPRGALPPVAREKIAQFKITLDTRFVPPFNVPEVLLPPDAQVIVHSGKVRYRTQHKQFVLFNDARILNDLSSSDAVYVATPTRWAESRNPREEDRQIANRLTAHLNSQLEFYHQAIWAWLDPERRFMLLDAILVPGQGGKSVASIVQNRVVGVAGNSLIMPLAPGIRIDPRVNNESEGDLRDLYAADSPPAIRISVPTRGVYAEAIMGNCNACEEIDDSRYWRWTDAGMLAPPELSPVDTASRAEDDAAVTATALPAPVVHIQNAPVLPNPVGLGEVFATLAKPDLFPDITGLEGTQKNAKAAFDSALSAASSMATQAAGLAKQNITASNGERLLERIGQAKADGLLTPGAAQSLSQQVLGTMVGEPNKAGETKAASPAADPQVQKVIDKAAQADKAEIKVTTNDESLELSFDGGDTKIGAAAPAAGLFETKNWIDLPVTQDWQEVSAGAFSIGSRTYDTFADFKKALGPNFATFNRRFVQQNPADANKFQLFRRLRIAYPADPVNARKIKGTEKLPLAVLVHGQHESWEGGVEIPNHAGYSYLQDALAKQGVVSVSVDTNAANFADSFVDMRAAMILEAIDAVKKMAANPSNQLYGRIDFDHIGLMGHSRGGDAVVAAAVRNKTAPRGVIRAVVSLAPTDWTGELADSTKRLTLDSAASGFYLVIYGGLDGDVSGAGGARSFWGTGFRHYDRARCQKAMLYIPGCCHNRFNRTWSADDYSLHPDDVVPRPRPAPLLPDPPRVHSRADHEALLTEYVTGLFRWKLMGDSAKAGLFDGLIVNSQGHDASLQWTHGKDTKLIDDFDTGVAPTGVRTVVGADVQAFPDVVVGGNRLESHTGHQTKILAIRENIAAPAQPALQIEFSDPHGDWGGYRLLQLGLGTWIDVTNEATINAGDPIPPLDIVLIDGAGASAICPSAGFTTPDLPGKPFLHNIVERDNAGNVIRETNVSMHRLSTVSISLGGLGVNLRDLRKLQIVPGAGFAQRIFIDSLWLVK